MTRKTKRRFMRDLGVTAAATTTPGFIGFNPLSGPETFTNAAVSGEVDIKKHGIDGNPSFIVPVSEDADGGLSELETWTNEDIDNGQVIRKYENLDMMALSAPWSEAGRDQLWRLNSYGGGLEDLDYVEYAAPNVSNLSIPEPAKPHQLAESGAVSFGTSWTEGLLTPDAETTGLAFDQHAPEVTLEEARELINAPTSLVDSIDTSGVTVHVIDTGLNARDAFADGEGNTRVHDLSTNFSGSGDPTVGEDGLSAVADGNGHGDWVSMCISSSSSDDAYKGLAPGADITVSKSLDDEGSGDIDDIIAGIDLAIEAGADVACLSLGSFKWNQALADALSKAWEAGVFCAVAVGNDRFGSVWVASPASAERGFGVTATNVPESGNREDARIANFANTGPATGVSDLSEGKSEGAKPKLAAPGMNIKIDPVDTLSGTSMAAPFVTGSAALLRADGHDVEETWDRLTKSAYRLPNAGATETEYGLLDVQAALDGVERDESQEDARTDEAQARDEFHKRYSGVTGRRLTSLI